MSQDLLESIDGGIATLTMNRPDSRNALSRAMMTGLAESLARLALDPKVRVVVLTGAGRAFCWGATSRASRSARPAAATTRSRASTRRSPTFARGWRRCAGSTRCRSRRSR